MTSGHVLELLSLPTMHPQCGDALLEQCALSLIVRLSIDPTRLAKGMMSREVSVNWLATPDGVELCEERIVSWVGASAGREDALVQWPVGVSSQRQTEDAAIAVTALLLHNLACAEIVKVLRIGSGGDYLVQLAGDAGLAQAESSGIRSDPTGSESKSVLNKKKAQVLKKCDSGFASVTTFLHTKSVSVHSYLHQVRRAVGGDQPKKIKKARRR